MADFEAITTQEALDAIVEERMGAERKSMEEKYKGYMSPEDYGTKKTGYESQISNLNKSIQEKDAKIAAFEVESTKMKVAREQGLPFESVSFLQGTDEKTIKASAEQLKALMGTSKRVPPLAQTEEHEETGKKGAIKKLLNGLKGEE